MIHRMGFEQKTTKRSKQERRSHDLLPLTQLRVDQRIRQSQVLFSFSSSHRE